ncbi:hypothetical protein JCM24511_02722 [Saitozyma sp. JCM 24511]|nr:hypothetical protein JCM24511_02722 [Saitozyma sp. JCM 24511]
MYNETYEQQVKNVVVGSVGNGVGIGALLLGPWTAVLLYGMCIHLFLHWLAHAADTERRWVKITVYWLAFASTGTVGFYIWWDFWLFVQNFGSYVGFADQRFPPTIWVIEIVHRTPVTAFFAERAWRLVGKSKVFLVIMCTLISVVGAVGSRASVPAVVLLLVSQLISDIIVTSTISYKLIRSRTGWTATDRLVRKLLVLLVETQLPPTVCTITYLIIFVTNSNNNIQAFFACAPIVYVAAFLFSLNMRITLRNQDVTQGNERKASSSKTASGSRRLPTTVHVTTEQYVELQSQSRSRSRSCFRSQELGLELEAEPEVGRSINRSDPEGLDVYANANADADADADADTSPSDYRYHNDDFAQSEVVIVPAHPARPIPMEPPLPQLPHPAQLPQYHRSRRSESFHRVRL